MQKKISVLIPVYRGSELLEPLIKSLVKDTYRKKEIFVTIDEPTEESLNIVRKYKADVRFVINKKRVGKANALNKLVKLSKGDVLLFLDSDIVIPSGSKNFLRGVSSEIENTDILNIKIVTIGDSFLSKLVSYDYLSSNLILWMWCKIVGKSIGLDGAAFAIKRNVFEELGYFNRVIAEDLDMATRGCVKGKKFKYAGDMEVLNKPPSTGKDWFKQRKRWALGTALWIRGNYRLLAGCIKRYPKLLLPALIFILPLFIFFLTISLIPATWVEKLFLLFLVLLPPKFGVIIPLAYFTSLGIIFIKNLMLMILNYIAVSIIFYYFARKIKHRFNPLEFIVYFYFYSLIFLFMVMVSLIRVTTSRHEYRLEDWKI